MASCLAVLLIRMGIWDYLGIVINISPLNIFRDPLIEPSRRDGSYEGSQHMFSLQSKRNYL